MLTFYFSVFFSSLFPVHVRPPSILLVGRDSHDSYGGSVTIFLAEGSDPCGTSARYVLAHRRVPTHLFTRPCWSLLHTHGVYQPTVHADTAYDIGFKRPSDGCAFTSRD